MVENTKKCIVTIKKKLPLPINKSKMAKTVFITGGFLLLLLVFSCSSSTESRMKGDWKVTDVQTDFNEDEVTPEMLKQVVEMQKQTFFRILNDSTMVIISNNNTHEAKWFIDDETKEISYIFGGTVSTPHVLGKLKNGVIVSESTTPLGAMTIIYSKE